MVKYCGAYNCTSKSKKNCGISFHAFPKSEIIRKKWIIATRRKDYVPSQSATLCSKHFHPEDFIHQFGRTILKSDAIPSIFNFPPHLVKKTRKPRSTRISECDDSNTESGSSASNPAVCESANSLKSMDETADVEVEASTSLTLPVEVETSTTLALPNINKRKRTPATFGDCDSRDLADLNKAKLMWSIATKTIEKQRKTIKYFQTRNSRLKKKIQTITDLLKDLKGKNKISTDCYSLLQECLPASQRQLLLRKLKANKGAKYPQDLRTFALTLNFYSSSAYNYVRRTYDNCLPHPSTLKKWYSSVDGSPGYTKESLAVVKQKVEEQRNQGKTLICALIVDEMSIRQHVEMCGNRQTGYVNYGYDMDSDSLPIAKDVIVFLLVGLNSRWKIPIAYFLINGLNAEERANLVKGCFIMMEDTGVKIVSITFDGAAVNVSMAHALGADLTYPSLKTFFPHPISKEKVYIILDPCHMIKLIRNALGDLGEMRDGEGNAIYWHFFERLVQMQEKFQLHLGTKIRRRHINYEKEKMKVKLAVQVLSKSVGDALVHCEKDLHYKEFENSEATSKFCYMFNSLFDILNTRNNLSKNPYKKSITENNLSFVDNFFERCKEYITSLRTKDNINVLESRRKMGFLGLVVTMNSIKGIIEDHIINNKHLNYLLTYKLNQDHIELFFSSIRARGGFNNNPTAKQFEGAYKRLLVHVQIKTSENSNCVSQDEIRILNVTSGKKANNYDFYDKFSEYLTNIDSHSDDEEDSFLPDINCKYIENVVEYIAGFVCRKVLKLIDCVYCQTVIKNSEKIERSALIERKNLGGLITPSTDFVFVCKAAEKVFRSASNYSDLNKLILLCIREIINFPNLFSILQEHILDQDPLNNHRYLLLYYIVKTYLTVRIHYKNSTVNEIKDRVRHKFTKIIHFRHQ